MKCVAHADSEELNIFFCLIHRVLFLVLWFIKAFNFCESSMMMCRLCEFRCGAFPIAYKSYNVIFFFNSQFVILNGLENCIR